MPDRIQPDRNSQIGDRHTEPGRTQTDMIQSEGNRARTQSDRYEPCKKMASQDKVRRDTARHEVNN
jgi:hypothetical protein